MDAQTLLQAQALHEEHFYVLILCWLCSVYSIVKFPADASIG